MPDFSPSVLSPEDKNVQSSFLLLTVKDHNLARSNTFIGEALVRLSSVPLVESDAIACQPKTLQLKLTRPGIEAGALQLLEAIDTSFGKRILIMKVKTEATIKII